MTLKIKRVAIAILGFLLTLSIAVSLAFYNNTGKMTVSADTESAEGMLLQETYGINDELKLSKTITFEHNGTTVEARDGVIVYPDGTSYVINPVNGDEQTFVLDTLGQYTIKYYFGDVTYCDYFIVESRLYSLSDYSASTIFAYTKEGTAEDYDKDIYRNHKSNVTCAAGTYTWDATKETEVKTEGLMTQYKRSKYTDGLIVKMKEGVTFNYAEPINLNDASEDGLSNIMSFSMLFIEFFDDYGYHNSQEESSLKERKEIATSAYITLTDAYDPTNYIQVLISWEGESLYARASTADIASQAISVGSLGNTAAYSREVYYGSQRSIVYTDRYGASCGVKPNIKGHSSKIHLRYDNEKGIMYWGEEKTNDIRGGTTSYSSVKNIDKNIIMDLKNPAVTGGPVFPGFTTGEVYVSLNFADAKLNEPARVDIYSIGNKNANDIINASETYSDKTAPLVNINNETTINDGVYAKVGYDFSIPSANAFDVNLKGDVSVNVYRAYGTSIQSSVKIQDGKFNVAYNDIYYIVYSATDYYGNVGNKILKVFGVNKDVIDFNVTDAVASSVEIMEETPLVLGDKISTINNYKDLKLKIEFISEKESFVYADLKSGKEIDAFLEEEHQFTVKYAGEYTIRFTYSDNAVGYVYDETFTALSNAEKVTFSSAPLLPRILLKDAVYDFETVDAFGYANGGPENLGKAKLQIKFDNGSFTDIANIRKVKITGTKTAVLRAVYGNNTIESEPAIIKNVNYAYAKENEGAGLSVVDYFHYDDKAFTIPDNYVETGDLVFVSNNHQSKNTIKFANMVSLKNFEIVYQIPKNFSNYNKLTFVFTDPYNPENVLNVSMYKKAGAVYYLYNGVEVKSNLQFGVNNEKRVQYHAMSGLLTLSGVAGSCATDVKFTTPLAYLDIVLEDIRGQAGIYVLSMNGQQLWQVMMDDVAPQMISEVMVGKYGIGQNITLPAVKVVDLFSIVEYGSVITKCLFNGEKVVTSIDNVRLDGTANQSDKDYTIKLKDYGTYTYTYEVVDPFGNADNFTMFIDPIDKQAPTITFTGNIKEGDKVTVKVGDTINLKYSVSDNRTNKDDLNTNIIMRDCDKAILYPVNSNSIKFEKVGRFEISIVCQDNGNNVTIKSFEVVVEPA